MTLPNSNKDDPQAEKFRDLARKLECEDDEVKFEQQVKQIAQVQKPRQDEAGDD